MNRKKMALGKKSRSVTCLLRSVTCIMCHCDWGMISWGANCWFVACDCKAAKREAMYGRVKRGERGGLYIHTTMTLRSNNASFSGLKEPETTV